MAPRTAQGEPQHFPHTGREVHVGTESLSVELCKISGVSTVQQDSVMWPQVDNHGGVSSPLCLRACGVGEAGGGGGRGHRQESEVHPVLHSSCWGPGAGPELCCSAAVQDILPGGSVRFSVRSATIVAALLGVALHCLGVVFFLFFSITLSPRQGRAHQGGRSTRPSLFYSAAGD